MQYVKNQFYTFRAITKIHLGSLSDNLLEGEEVEFDGFTLRRGGQDHALHSLRGAIKAGWLVPNEDTSDKKYVPQPAGVVVHKANGLGNQEINLGVSADEEDVNVGTLQQVRSNTPPVRKASAPTKNSGTPTPNESEGVVVARFKSPAKFGPVQVGIEDQQVVQKLDNKTSVEIERVGKAIATGDVQEAIGGESLEDLLPNAASAGTPEPGVVFDGERVKSATADLELIRQFIPGFEWDLGVHWRKRAKMAVDQYGKIPAVIKYILSVETDAVRSEIETRTTSA